MTSRDTTTPSIAAHDDADDGRDVDAMRRRADDEDDDEDGGHAHVARGGDIARDELGDERFRCASGAARSRRAHRGWAQVRAPRRGSIDGDDNDDDDDVRAHWWRD